MELLLFKMDNSSSRNAIEETVDEKVIFTGETVTDR